MARARDELMDTVTDAVTRSFRPAFAVAAALAAAAAIPALAVAMSAQPAAARRARPAKRSTVGIGVAALVGLALLATEFAAGARDVGKYVAADPCTAGPDPYSGDGLDGTVQRIALSALNGAACELGTTRERLVLSVDPDSGYDDVTWDDETVERALRVGARRGDRRRRRARLDPRLDRLGAALRRRPCPDRLAHRAPAPPRLTSTGPEYSRRNTATEDRPSAPLMTVPNGM